MLSQSIHQRQIFISGQILHFLKKFSPHGLSQEKLFAPLSWPCWYPGDDTRVSTGLCKHHGGSGERIQTGQCSLRSGAECHLLEQPPVPSSVAVPVCDNRKSLFPSTSAHGPEINPLHDCFNSFLPLIGSHRLCALVTNVGWLSCPSLGSSMSGEV